MAMIQLDIETDSKESIQLSFDKIAVELIRNWNIKINKTIFSLTEIEFYFFHEKNHQDNATHEHKFEAGSWRLHAQGLDISLGYSDVSDGGILIRGVKSDSENINGPRRVVQEIFKGFGQVTNLRHEFGLTPKSDYFDQTIYKTKRHGLSPKQINEFKDENYRYYTDLDNWKHISLAEKERIKTESFFVK